MMELDNRSNWLSNSCCGGNKSVDLWTVTLFRIEDSWTGWDDGVLGWVEEGWGERGQDRLDRFIPEICAGKMKESQCQQWNHPTTAALDYSLIFIFHHWVERQRYRRQLDLLLYFRILPVRRNDSTTALRRHYHHHHESKKYLLPYHHNYNQNTLH